MSSTLFQGWAAGSPGRLCEVRHGAVLHAKAQAGQIKNFTGLMRRMRAPEGAEVHLNTVDLNRSLPTRL